MKRLFSIYTLLVSTFIAATMQAMESDKLPVSLAYGWIQRSRATVGTAASAGAGSAEASAQQIALQQQQQYAHYAAGYYAAAAAAAGSASMGAPLYQLVTPAQAAAQSVQQAQQQGSVIGQYTFMTAQQLQQQQSLRATYASASQQAPLSQQSGAGAGAGSGAPSVARNASLNDHGKRGREEGGKADGEQAAKRARLQSDPEISESTKQRLMLHGQRTQLALDGMTKKLIDGIKAQDLGRAQEALSQGANPNAVWISQLTPTGEFYVMSPMLLAAKAGASDIAQLLKQYAAAPIRAQVPFIQACIEGDSDTIAVLAEKESINYTNFLGRTGLHLAALHNRKNAVKQLLTLPGININARDIDDSTPLALASHKGNLDIADVLLGAGADMTIKTRSGEDVFARTRHITDEGGRNAMLALLNTHAEQRKQTELKKQEESKS